MTASAVQVPEAATIEVNGAPLALRSWGDEAAPALLYLHGLSLTSGTIGVHEVASALAGRGYRVLAYDQPGFGESPALPPERYLLDGLAALALGVLDTLGVARAAVLGFSWGASVAVHVAAGAPARVPALVLLDAGHVDAEETPTWPGQLSVQQHAERARPLAEEMVFDDISAMLAAVRGEAARWTPLQEAAWRDAYVAHGGRVRPRLSIDIYAAATWGWQERPVRERWPQLAASGVPVLLLLATEPPERMELQRRTSARFAEAVPQAQLRWMQGHGHHLVNEVGPPLGDELADWLAGHGWS